MQFTTYTPATGQIKQIEIMNAASPAEVIKRVSEAFAPTAAVQMFLRALSEHVTMADMRIVKYALARTCYCEARDLEQVAVLAERTLERVLHHLKVLEIPSVHRITSDEATRVMLRMAD